MHLETPVYVAPVVPVDKSQNRTVASISLTKRSYKTLPLNKKWLLLGKEEFLDPCASDPFSSLRRRMKRKEEFIRGMPKIID